METTRTSFDIQILLTPFSILQAATPANNDKQWHPLEARRGSHCPNRGAILLTFDIHSLHCYVYVQLNVELVGQIHIQ